jgi:hypothetical protein
MDHPAPALQPVLPLLKSPFGTSSDPSTNPLLKSNCNPTGCSTAVTGVVPALSWNSVAKLLGSYHQPCSPLAKKEAGLNGRLNGECRLWKPLFFNTLWPF